MKPVADILQSFNGSDVALAEATKRHVRTIRGWIAKEKIPSRCRPIVLAAAVRTGVALSADALKYLHDDQLPEGHPVAEVFATFEGSPTHLASATGNKVQTVDSWKSSGNIPYWRRPAVLQGLDRAGKPLSDATRAYLCQSGPVEHGEEGAGA